MMNYAHLLLEERGQDLFVWMNRPDVHNAFNDEMIAEFVDLFSSASRLSRYRAVVLGGKGKNFCAGADLNWMSAMVSYTRAENIRDSSLMAKMFDLLDSCPVPLIGRVQGAAIGGGVGLVAVCDIAIAQSSSRFGLAEVKLGILPAVISPYVIAKIGVSAARALFLTGERFDAARALRIGLVHRLVDDEADLEAAITETLADVATSGPEAVRACKKLIAFVSTNEVGEAIPYTIEAIAERRISDEGQQGMKAFLGKQSPPWTPER
ncbi:MAG: enoyl-CoA hydratase-related protein [Acidobacteriota bacterium]